LHSRQYKLPRAQTKLQKKNSLNSMQQTLTDEFFRRFACLISSSSSSSSLSYRVDNTELTPSLHKHISNLYSLGTNLYQINAKNFIIKYGVISVELQLPQRFSFAAPVKKMTVPYTISHDALLFTCHHILTCSIQKKQIFESHKTTLT